MLCLRAYVRVGVYENVFYVYRNPWNSSHSVVRMEVIALVIDKQISPFAYFAFTFAPLHLQLAIDSLPYIPAEKEILENWVFNQ